MSETKPLPAWPFTPLLFVLVGALQFAVGESFLGWCWVGMGVSSVVLDIARARYPRYVRAINTMAVVVAVAAIGVITRQFFAGTP